MLDFYTLYSATTSEYEVARLFYRYRTDRSFLRYNPLFIDECIARVFMLAYRDNGRAGPGSIKIYSDVQSQIPENEKGCKKSSPDEDKLKAARRVETKLRQSNIDFCEAYRQCGINIPTVTPPMKNDHDGRPYDGANMELIRTWSEQSKKISYPDNTSITVSKIIFRYIFNGRIPDSDSVSANELATAYEEYSNSIIHAQRTTDPVQYISKWVDIFRCETSLHLTLIYEIANYILNNLKTLRNTYYIPLRESSSKKTKPEIPYDAFQAFWTTIPRPINGNPLEAYQVLRYNKYIRPLFDCENESAIDSFCYSGVAERLLQSEIVLNIYRRMSTPGDSCYEFFKPFFEGDETAIHDVYAFCKNRYPIIESHTPLRFHSTDHQGKNNLNPSQIKLIRRIACEIWRLEGTAMHCTSDI